MLWWAAVVDREKTLTPDLESSIYVYDKCQYENLHISMDVRVGSTKTYIYGCTSRFHGTSRTDNLWQALKEHSKEWLALLHT
jgi:hypothetical protein